MDPDVDWVRQNIYKAKALGFPLGVCVFTSVLDSHWVVTVGTGWAALKRIADSLMASGSSLEELTNLLSAAEDTVDRTKGLNLKNQAALRHLEVTLTQLFQEVLFPSQGYPALFCVISFSPVLFFCTLF